MALLRIQTVRDPRLIAVVGVLSGEDHQLGALMVALLVAVHGWRVVLLDHQAPARELADAAREVGAAALLVSFVHDHSATTQAEVDDLAKRLPSSIALLAGGRAASGYGHVRRIRLVSLDQLTGTLDEVAVSYTAG